MQAYVSADGFNHSNKESSATNLKGVPDGRYSHLKGEGNDKSFEKIPLDGKNIPVDINRSYDARVQGAS